MVAAFTELYDCVARSQSPFGNGRHNKSSDGQWPPLPEPGSSQLYAWTATAAFCESAFVMLATAPSLPWPGLRMSMPPLKKAPSSMLMRCAITSPVKDPSLRMSTRSLALMLPRTLPRTTTSRAEIFAETWPFRPTVTRLPGRLIAPATLPSMYNDSDPVTSPFTTRLLPIVAWSAAAGDAGEVLEVRVEVDSWLVGGGAGRRGGSVPGDIEGLPGW